MTSWHLYDVIKLDIFACIFAKIATFKARLVHVSSIIAQNIKTYIFRKLFEDSIRVFEMLSNLLLHKNNCGWRCHFFQGSTSVSVPIGDFLISNKLKDEASSDPKSERSSIGGCSRLCLKFLWWRHDPFMTSLTWPFFVNFSKNINFGELLYKDLTTDWSDISRNYWQALER